MSVDPRAALAASCVSRETSARLSHYVDLIEKWNSKINLVSRASAADIWKRHIMDSVQVFPFADRPVTHWADLGSGGGLPGLVVAIMASEHAPEMRVTLVESDQRKAVFCGAVIRELGLNASVIAERIESASPLKAQVVSARALAPLSALLGYADRHLSSSGRAIFQKGASHDKEIEEALASWSFTMEKRQSATDDAAVLLKIGDIKRV